MTSNEYPELLARFRRLLRSGGEGNEPLPKFLRPENIQVSGEVGERARRLRESILKGDIEAVREDSPELLASGFNRAESEEESIPELDDARERVQERLRRKEEEDGDDDSDTARDRRDDSR